jgi:hypothetical protein
LIEISKNKENDMKNFRPLILFVVFVFFVGLACSAASSGAPAQPEQPVQQPTQPEAPAPTDVPVQPTDIPPTEAPAASQFFTEEFDQDPAWNYFLTAGDEDKITVEFDNSRMIFDLEDLSIYAYYMYQGQEYEDVRIDIRAENRGKNNNNVSLVCRASDKGWYEFSTEGGGLWYLYAATYNDEKKIVYNRIDNGGAQSLKQGKEVNEYSMICKGNEITLIVNDKEIKKVTERNYGFNGGNVGFNISSLNVTPIIVDVDWFKVSQP